MTDGHNSNKVPWITREEFQDLMDRVIDIEMQITMLKLHATNTNSDLWSVAEDVIRLHSRLGKIATNSERTFGNAP